MFIQNYGPPLSIPSRPMTSHFVLRPQLMSVYCIIQCGQAIEAGQRSKEGDVSIPISPSNVTQPQPLNRFNSFLCQNARFRMLVCTFKPNFEIIRLDGVHSPFF